MSVCATATAPSVKSAKTVTVSPKVAALRIAIVMWVRLAKMDNALRWVVALVVPTLNAQHHKFASSPQDKLRAVVGPWLGNGVLVIRIAFFETVKTHAPRAPVKAGNARSLNLVIAVVTATAAATSLVRCSVMTANCA
jgi:hypothetical protein